MPFKNKLLTILKIFRNANGSLALTIKGGANSEGKGDAVIQMFTGAANAVKPGEITAFRDALGNGSMVEIASPTTVESGAAQRARVQVSIDESGQAFVAAIADAVSFEPANDPLGTNLFVDGTLQGGGVNGLTIANATLTSTAVIPVSQVALAFSGAWSNYNGAVFEVFAWGRDRSGRVSLTGMVKHGTLTQTGVIGVLPVGARPTLSHSFIVVANTGTARVDVQADGSVNLIAYIGTGNASFISLAGINFPT